ncbi:zinc finger CCCH domain-containing protein 13-like [Gadus morhua]|uniref:zinc finger CCCH domain-containing protein 13-like n=1 Tax=Gadus morhua TaxID=8049 RepID=UPI0011B621C9|nr:zinc finger CCCH domain-containing protein 13-like [Gadus morhua]
MGSSRCMSPTLPPRTSTPVPVESAALCNTTNPTYPRSFAFAKRSRATDVTASIRDMQEREEEREEERQEREEERLDRRHRVAREEALQDAIDARLHEDQRACSRWRKLQRSTQPSSKPSARGCRRLDTATLCRDPAIQGLTL